MCLTYLKKLNKKEDNYPSQRRVYENIWLTQKAMSAELFDKNVKTINRHIINIFGDSSK